METHITFVAQGLKIEGLLFSGDAKRGAVILHPHPLNGGDMNNVVVAAIAQTYQDAGWSTLRFNFRGTGLSEGVHDNGVGERADIDGAVACFQQRGIEQIDLVGYSFGAWVLAAWAQHHSQHGWRIMLVAPPVDFIDFSHIDGIAGLHAVIVGDSDNFAPTHQIQARMDQWCITADLSVIPNTDHFFGGTLEELVTVLADHIAIRPSNFP